jgi:hypothetical protein
MSIDLTNLCYYDKRNPDYLPYDEDDLTKMPSDCSCDNCFYGRSKLTEQLIWQQERMYSEEDMKSFGQFCADYDYRCFGKRTQEEMLQIWLEEFKHK